MKGLIIVVDDDESVRLTIEHILSSLGYKIVTAADGSQAIELFEDVGADLVITDLIMPVLDGAETIARLKKKKAGLKIIAMSGGARLGNDNILQKAKAEGADHIIAKPFEFDELVQLVNSSMAADK